MSELKISKIKKLKLHDLGDFNKYIMEQQPVIITDLYKKSPISKIDSIESFESEFGDVSLIIGKNYYDRDLLSDSSDNSEDELITVREFFTLIRDNPKTPKLCREQIIPTKIKDFFSVPDISKSNSILCPSSKIYVANEGHVAPLHFDLDQREVLFTQIVGKKNIYLVRPELSARFCPIRNFSGIPVHLFSEEEKKHFFAFNKAFVCKLEPGETLYMPKLWWHYIENIGVTAAFNVRFGLASPSMKLRSLPANYLTQNISRDLIDPVTREASDPELIDKLVDVFFDQYSSPLERITATENALQFAYNEICKTALKTPYLPEWYKSLQNYDQKKQMLYFGYYEPKKVCDGSPDSICNPEDLLKIKAVAAAWYLSDNGLNHLCAAYNPSNKFETMKVRDANLLCTNLLLGRYPEDLDNFRD